jgi:transposase
MLSGLSDGQILLADCAYDSDAMRLSLAERGAWANVKPMPNRKQIPAFSPFLYRYRNLVERFFNKLKHFRAVATRYDKRADNFLAGIKLASARIWMRFNRNLHTANESVA